MICPARFGINVIKCKKAEKECLPSSYLSCFLKVIHSYLIIKTESNNKQLLLNNITHVSQHLYRTPNEIRAKCEEWEVVRLEETEIENILQEWSDLSSLVERRRRKYILYWSNFWISYYRHRKKTIKIVSWNVKRKTRKI